MAKRRYNTIQDISSSSDDDSDYDPTSDRVKKPPRKRPRRNAAIKAIESIKKETEERRRKKEEEEEEEEEEDDEDDDEDDNEDDDEEDEKSGGGDIVIRLTGPDNEDDSKFKPRRYTIEKEPEEVQEFFKLITEPIKEKTIDDQIDDFKALDSTKKNELLQALKERPQTESSIQFMYKILTMNIPTNYKYMLLGKYNSLLNLDNTTTEYYKHRNWLDKVCSIPFGIYKRMPISLEDGTIRCGQFMEQARKYLDQAIFGQEEAKLQIMQFICSKIVNPNGGGMSLLLIGAPGIGKTSLIKNGIARAIDWPFQFISLGGDSDGSSFMGHQLVYESSHCGKIVNSLVTAQNMSIVLMFDEVDKISSTPKGEEIQNMLVHLTDPIQNMEFEDKYVGAIPIDMSKAMLVFTANDISKIDRVLLDRMTIIHLNGYSVDEKLIIAEQYILPSVLLNLNFKGNDITFSKDILKYIIEKYAREEKGVRELRRCIEVICQKINMLRLHNSTAYPFYIETFVLPFALTRYHIDLFLKKKKPEDDRDISIKMMYI